MYTTSVHSFLWIKKGALSFLGIRKCILKTELFDTAYSECEHMAYCLAVMHFLICCVVLVYKYFMADWLMNLLGKKILELFICLVKETNIAIYLSIF